MFEKYLIAANFLITKNEDTDLDEEKEIYLRSAIFHISSAAEAFVNQVGETAKLNSVFNELETHFLCDEELKLIPEKGQIKVLTRYYSLESKIKFLVKKKNFVKASLISNNNWEDFQKFREFRNELIHPRSQNQDIPLSYLDGMALLGLRSTIYILNDLSETIFAKPIRQQLLDLS